MFVNPKFEVVSNPQIDLLGIVKDASDGYPFEFIELEKGNFVRNKMPKKSDRIVLTNLSGGMALFLNADGTIETDYVQN